MPEWELSMMFVVSRQSRKAGDSLIRLIVNLLLQAVHESWPPHRDGAVAATLVCFQSLALASFKADKQEWAVNNFEPV